MHFTQIILTAYALLVLLGGLFGYIKAKSFASLISAVLTAVIVGAAVFLFPHHPKLSLALATATGLILTAVMFYRFKSTGKPMPALPVAIVSFLVFAYSGYELVKLLGKHTS